MFLLSIIKFIIFTFIVLFIPGYFFIRNTVFKKTGTIIFVSISLGLAVFTATSLLGRFLNFRYLGLVTAFILVLWLLIKKGISFQPKFKKRLTNFKDKFFLTTLAIIIAGCFFQNLIPAKSGTSYDFGIGYWSALAHDGVWHEALAQDLITNFPPNNPGLSGTKLTNYHYLYDLLVAQTNISTGISLRDLIYRFYPLLFSILLGLGSYTLVLKLYKNRLAAVFSLFFVYFGSSFGWIIEYARQRTLGGESTFWANQPVSMNINPPFAVSLVFLVCAIYLFLIIKKNRKIVLSFILISSVLIGFKVYGGLVLIGALGTFAIIKLFFEKDLFYLKIFIPIFAISLSIFLLQTSMASGLLEIKPFWFINSMIDDPDRVGWLKLASARSSYFSGGNWIKFSLVEVVSFAIFVVGNLGTRIVGFFVAKEFKVRFFLRKSSLLFWTAFFSFLIPLFIVQKGNPWNTIQFFYYFLYIFSLISGYSLVLLYKKMRKISLIIIIALLLTTPISSYSTFRSGFQGAPAKITLEEESALAFLRDQKSGIVLTPPFNSEIRKSMKSPFTVSIYETSAYVAAGSAKPIFIEDEIQQDILQNSYKARIADSNIFFKGASSQWSKSFLKQNQIGYIYIPKIYNVSLNQETLNIRKIFENNDTLIYEVK